MSAFFSKSFADDIGRAFLTFCAQVVELEVRSRTRPVCLDAPTTAILLKHFYLALVHYRRWRNANVRVGTDRIAALIHHCIVTDNPPEDYSALVWDLGTTCHEQNDLFAFLRQAAIFEHFSLEVPLSPERLLDWDDLLSYPSLVVRYRPTTDTADHQSPDLSLPPFPLKELPASYLSLLMPPYSLDLLDTKSQTALCLLTGAVVSLEANARDSYMKHLKSNCGGGTSILLILTGPRATSVVFASFEFNKVLLTKGIYLDTCGDEDPGFRLGRVLTLSQDRLEQLIDTFLSGDWTDLLSNDGSSLAYVSRH
jgi:hypothetical protein